MNERAESRREKASSDLNEAFKSQFTRIREKILEKFLSKTEGINIERINSFFESKKLRTPSLLFVEEKDLPALLEEVNTRLGSDITLEGDNGIYVPELDLAIVKRKGRAEALNSSFHSEMIAVHEIAHGTSQFRDFYFTRTESGRYDPQLLRTGFQIHDDTRWGAFFEEAFADYMCSEYALANIPEDRWQDLAQDIEEIVQNHEPIQKNTSLLQDSPHGIIEVPAIYTIKVDGGVGMTASAYAGSAIYLLKRIEPGIENVLIQSRGSVEGLRRFARIIDTLEPGLYMALRSLPYEEESFEYGNALIRKAVKNE